VGFEDLVGDADDGPAQVFSGKKHALRHKKRAPYR
jgi:hypothetical protein